jgi:hypothetical protein
MMTVRTEGGDHDAPTRRVLCVFPAYSPSFGTFDTIYGMRGISAFMPPQGLLLIAAYLPRHWEVRFVDENVRAASAADLAWADAVMVSGMHIQRRQIADIAARPPQTGIRNSTICIWANSATQPTRWWRRCRARARARTARSAWRPRSACRSRNCRCRPIT